MAKATIKIATTKTIVLELSEREAETLRIISGGVGGDPQTTRRGDIDAIRGALGCIGVLSLMGHMEYTGSIVFQEEVVMS